MPRYLRFVQTLCLGSGLVAVACSDDNGNDESKDARGDAVTNTDTDTDTPHDTLDAVADMTVDVRSDVMDTAVQETRPVTVDGPLPPPNLPVRA